MTFECRFIAKQVSHLQRNKDTWDWSCKANGDGDSRGMNPDLKKPPFQCRTIIGGTRPQKSTAMAWWGWKIYETSWTWSGKADHLIPVGGKMNHFPLFLEAHGLRLLYQRLESIPRSQGNPRHSSETYEWVKSKERRKSQVNVLSSHCWSLKVLSKCQQRNMA